MESPGVSKAYIRLRAASNKRFRVVSSLGTARVRFSSLAIRPDRSESEVGADMMKF